MHSRIFQLSKQPIHSDDYIEEWHFEDNLPYPADYIDEDTDKEEDIKLFLRAYGHFGVTHQKESLDPQKYDETEADVFVFSSDFKRNYFANRYELFRQSALALTFEQYINPFSPHELNRLLDDQFTVKVHDIWTITLDSFVRDLPDEETKRYIGKTMDFHF